MDSGQAKFGVGHLIHHRLFDYRGVVVDIDPSFQGSDDWYVQVARTRPPKDQPWYRVLVHGAEHMTYVAERNLEPDTAGGPIVHPAVEDYFDGFREGSYVGRRSIN